MSQFVLLFFSRLNCHFCHRAVYQACNPENMKVFTWPWEKQLCVHNFFLILLQTKGPTFIISYSFQRDIGNKMVQEIRTFLRRCDFVDSKLTSPLTSFARPAKIIEGFWTWMVNWISGSGISVLIFFPYGQFSSATWIGLTSPETFQNLKFVKKKMDYQEQITCQYVPQSL